MGQHGTPQEFANTQTILDREAPQIRQERERLGLEGLVGGLAAIVINTEPEEQQGAVAEMLRHTGLDLADAFETADHVACVVRVSGSADVLVCSRRTSDNPFRPLNNHPKSHHLPNTRLETLVFETSDLARYVEIQKARGIVFMTPEPLATDSLSYIQTRPSAYTGTSAGFVQWSGRRGDWAGSQAKRFDWPERKPPNSYSANVRQLDHVALRVTAAHRDLAILELMNLTNYNFDFAYYVEELNSITNVTRRSHEDAAVVVTSGISPYVDDQTSGPTEKFVRNFGARTHHLAFWTEKIEETFAALQADGVEFLIELVGSPEEGLKQTFTQPSRHTLIVHEYILRYGDFDGFFTRSNVTALTAATAKQ
jgi:4-hydroxyphenylpyruvate dioxygenase-like putative hemolysin